MRPDVNAEDGLTSKNKQVCSVTYVASDSAYFKSHWNEYAAYPHEQLLGELLVCSRPLGRIDRPVRKSAASRASTCPAYTSYGELVVPRASTRPAYGGSGELAVPRASTRPTYGGSGELVVSRAATRPAYGGSAN